MSGCATARKSEPARTATEELLISAAADRAAEALGEHFPAGRRIFVDAGNFDALDGKYAIGAIRDALLRHGDALVDSKAAADTVVELRSGANSTDSHDMLIGIPSFSIPVPLSGSFSVPKLALYDKDTVLAVAKFAATGIDARSGALVASTAPQYGYARRIKHTVLLFISWTEDDVIPKAQRDPDYR